MPLGDSITAGYSLRDSYRWRLWRLIKRGGFNVDFVGSVHPQTLPDHGVDPDHEGHWGFFTTEILKGLPSWLSANTPDIVLLHIGTNDIGTCRDPKDTANTIKNIIELIQSQNPKAIILLAKIIPINSDGRCSTGKSFGGTVRQLNEKLDVISTEKPSIVLVDLYSALDAKTDFRDSVHPTTEGFNKMAQAWFQALTPILVEGSVPTDGDSSAPGRSPPLQHQTTK